MVHFLQFGSKLSIHKTNTETNSTFFIIRGFNLLKIYTNKTQFVFLLALVMPFYKIITNAFDNINIL